MAEISLPAIKERRVPLLMRPGVLGRLSAINVALLCFGFPITATVPLFLNMDSFVFNMLLRAVYLGLSLYLVIGACLYPRFHRLSPGGWAIILFWTIYSIRVFYDVHVEGLVFRRNLFKLYGFMFGNCLIGALATLFTLRMAPPDFLRKATITAIALGCVGILAGVVYQYQTINPAEIVGRARFTIDNGTERGRDVLNPITISLTGQLMVTACTFLLFKGGGSLFKKLITVSGLVIGFVVLLLGGSRGPFLSTVLNILVLLGVFLYQTRKTPVNLLRLGVVFSTTITAGIFYVVNYLDPEKLLVLRRLQELSEGAGDEYRTFQWTAAWNQFLSSPVIGDRYLEAYANFYPHNIYLEVLMATGLLGGTFFLAILLIYSWQLFTDIVSNSERLFFGLVLLSILTSLITSGSLFQSVILWAGLSLYFGVRKKQFL